MTRCIIWGENCRVKGAEKALKASKMARGGEGHWVQTLQTGLPDVGQDSGSVEVIPNEPQIDKGIVDDVRHKMEEKVKRKMVERVEGCLGVRRRRRRWGSRFGGGADRATA